MIYKPSSFGIIYPMVFLLGLFFVLISNYIIFGHSHDISGSNEKKKTKENDSQSEKNTLYRKFHSVSSLGPAAMCCKRAFCIFMITGLLYLE